MADTLVIKLVIAVNAPAFPNLIPFAFFAPWLLTQATTLAKATAAVTTRSQINQAKCNWYCNVKASVKN